MNSERIIQVYAVGGSLFAQYADGSTAKLVELKEGTSIKSINTAIWEGVTFEDDLGVVRHIDQHGVMRVLPQEQIDKLIT